MKLFLSFILCTIIFTSNAKAADFTLNFTPADSSVTDAKVSDVTIAKVTGLQTLLNAVAKLTDLVLYAKKTDLQAAVPVGTIVVYSGQTAPTGWRFANGDTLNVADYPDLYAAIGNSFTGIPNGKTFGIPDTRGIFIRGASQGGSQAVNGVTYSASFGAKQSDQFQSHRHGFIPGGGYGAGAVNNAKFRADLNSPASDWGIGQVDVPTSDPAIGSVRTGPETRPANIALNYIIKVTN